MPLTFAPDTAASTPLYAMKKSNFEDWLAGQPDPVRAFASATGFSAGLGQVLSVPDQQGNLSFVVAGLGSDQDQKRVHYTLAAAVPTLPEGTYKLTSDLEDAEVQALGWLLSGYRFDRYKSAPTKTRDLIAPAGVDAARIEAIVAGEALTRDLINTPANDMGPAALEVAARDLARVFGADIDTVTGDDLLAQNFPMIHAVGRAADQAPRLIDMRWGESGPKLTLVGKGVCFDTGGLNLKPGASMGLMKKDMGGAATVLGLARIIMALGLKLQLRVLIPAVENAVSAGAMRPGDILTSRKGLTVEINNTDAEGRLVLADALALADEDAPDQIISMATLTGAARVALGPDLAPFYTDDESMARAISAGGDAMADPVWRMPFHDPYEDMIEPGIADLDNAPAGGFGGSITAALFLRRFVETTPYTHFDIYGWQPKPAPGRPKGGAMLGAKALFAALPDVLNL